MLQCPSSFAKLKHQEELISLLTSPRLVGFFDCGMIVILKYSVTYDTRIDFYSNLPALKEQPLPSPLSVFQANLMDLSLNRSELTALLLESLVYGKFT